MNELHNGIILRTYLPKKQKLIILDESLGKIECVPKNKQLANKLSHGVYISYMLKRWFFYYVIFDIHILDLPFYWSRNNFLFFHHVLELCNYFLPFDSRAGDIFQLILILYRCPEKVKTTLSKKLFLCNFFKKLGMYPQNIESYDSIIFNLISNFLHSKFSYEQEMAMLRNIVHSEYNTKEGEFYNSLREKFLIFQDLNTGNKSLCSDLNRWLLECISLHPYAHRLKTIEFLKNEL